jgi:hypothetical protein
MFMMK